MAAIEADLRTALTGHAGFSALVGTRVYPQQLPDNPTLPAVVYSRISSRYKLASGNVPAVRARIQIDCWDDNQVTCWDVADQVHAALDFASPTGLHVVFPEDDDDGFDTEAQLYRRRIDVFCWRIT